MTIPIALAMLGLVLAGGGSGQAIQGALIGGSAALQQAQINFTRQHESEADRIGIKTLSQSGYDPNGMVTFFETMNRETRAGGEGPPEYLRTHPVNVSRIAEAGDRASRMPTPKRSSQLDFFLMQARLRVLISESPGEALEYFSDRKLRADINEEELQAIEYGSAIALQKQAKYQQARDSLESLMALGPHRAYELQLAELDLVSGHDEAAIERLERLNNNFPGNHAIVMEYGRALLYEKEEARARKAVQILSEQVIRNGDDPRLQELYAQALQYSGNQVRASEAIAESYFLRGQIHEAILQLTRLVEKPDLTYYQRARITARLDEMQQTLIELDEPPQQG
jgi:predicted Zn-dependent protease